MVALSGDTLTSPRPVTAIWGMASIVARLSWACVVNGATTVINSAQNLISIRQYPEKVKCYIKRRLNTDTLHRWLRANHWLNVVNPAQVHSDDSLGFGPHEHIREFCAPNNLVGLV